MSILFIHPSPGYLLTNTYCFYLFKAWQLSEILSLKESEDWWCSSLVEYLSSTSEVLRLIFNTAMYNASDCIYWFLHLSVDTNSWADVALWYSLREMLRSRRAFIRIYFGGIMEVLILFRGLGLKDTFANSVHSWIMWNTASMRIQKSSYLAGHSLIREPGRWWNLL